MFRALFVICAIVAAVHAANYTWGIRQHNDRLIDRSFAKRSSSLARVVTLDVYYPNKTVGGLNQLHLGLRNKVLITI